MLRVRVEDKHFRTLHNYNDVIMRAMASQITSLTIVYSTIYSGADQRKHQSSASLAFVRGIHRWPVNSPHKGPVTLKMFPFDDVIMMEFYFVYNGFGPEKQKHIQYNTLQTQLHIYIASNTSHNNSTFFHPTILSFIILFIHSSYYTFMLSFIHHTIHSFIHHTIHSSHYSFIHSFTYSLTH